MYQLLLSPVGAISVGVLVLLSTVFHSVFCGKASGGQWLKLSDRNINELMATLDKRENFCRQMIEEVNRRKSELEQLVSQAAQMAGVLEQTLDSLNQAFSPEVSSRFQQEFREEVQSLKSSLTLSPGCFESRSVLENDRSVPVHKRSLMKNGRSLSHTMRDSSAVSPLDAKESVYSFPEMDGVQSGRAA